MSNVAVIGSGYVGLTSGACLAHIGHHVTCVDSDLDRVEQLRGGTVPILEDRLDGLVVEGLASGRLRFASDPAAAVADAEFVMLCVPTPQADDGSADLTYLRQAVSDVRPHLAPDSIVVNKSTVPVGSAKIVERELERPDVAVVSNPEFLRQGTAVHDFLHPDRIVIGADDQSASIRTAALYAPLGAPVVACDPASAETIKYVSNAFLAMKLSFVNAVSDICDQVDANVAEVMLGMGHDPRIGHTFLKPGPGWGGSCFPKDTAALMHLAGEVGVAFEVLEAAIRANVTRFDQIADVVVDATKNDPAPARVAVWGLTFKAGTDDTRSSPAVEVVDRLLAAGREVVACDPAARLDRDDITRADSCAEACDGADMLVVLTEWPQFGSVGLTDAAQRMRHRRLLDTRNVVDLATARRLGFEIFRMGR